MKKWIVGLTGFKVNPGFIPVRLINSCTHHHKKKPSLSNNKGGVVVIMVNAQPGLLKGGASPVVAKCMKMWCMTRCKGATKFTESPIREGLQSAKSVY
jgi:hypothetical protein